MNWLSQYLWDCIPHYSALLQPHNPGLLTSLLFLAPPPESCIVSSVTFFMFFLRQYHFLVSPLWPPLKTGATHLLSPFSAFSPSHVSSSNIPHYTYILVDSLSPHWNVWSTSLDSVFCSSWISTPELCLAHSRHLINTCWTDDETQGQEVQPEKSRNNKLLFCFSFSIVLFLFLYSVALYSFVSLSL